MPAWLLPALLGGGKLLEAWGNSRKPKTSAAVPPDLAGLRGQSIGLLQALLGPGAFDPGGVGQNMFFGAQNDLQRASRSGMETFLRQPAPEQRAFDMASPALKGILDGGGPEFEHDLSLANSQGGRFGSANAVLRGEAIRHAYNARTQAAQTLGMLGQGAGEGPFARLLAGANYGDQDSNRRAQLLSGLLGLGAGSTLGLPVTQQQNGLSALGGAGSNIAQLLMLMQAMGLGGGKNTPTTDTSGGGYGNGGDTWWGQ